MSKIVELLSEIQQSLVAPKGQTNKFGNYKYRSCEDIVEAVKPLLNGAVLTLNDEMVLIGDRYYIKATAGLMKEFDGTLGVIERSAYARETEDKKGMDAAQITGSASSYARKYALNGLFAIDDTKDADTKDNTVKIPQKTKDEVYKQTLECIENADENGLQEVWGEFDTDEKAVLWGMFNSQQRSFMKKMMKGD